MSTKKCSRRSIKMLLMRSLCFQLLLCFLIMSATQSQSEAVYKKAGLKPTASGRDTEYCQNIKFNLNSAIFDKGDALEAGRTYVARLWPMEVSKTPTVIIGFRDESEPVGISLTRANELKEYFVHCWRVDPEVISVRNYGTTCPRSGEKSLNARAIVCTYNESVEGVEAFLNCSPGSTPKLLTEAPAIVNEPPPPPDIGEESPRCPEEKWKSRRRAPRSPGTKIEEEAPPTKPPPTRRRPGL